MAAEHEQGSLPARVARGVGIACLSAAAVVPFITAIDMSVTMKAAGRAPTVWAALRGTLGMLFRTPGVFVRRREFRVIYGLYSSTYVAANSSSTIASAYGRDAVAAKVAVTAAVNTPLCIRKDGILAQIHGTRVPATPAPAFYLLLVARDVLTITASFGLPAVVYRSLEGRVPSADPRAVVFASQIIAVESVQPVCTALYLWGLTIYNAPSATPAERGRAVLSNLLEVTMARMLRVIPPFIIGITINNGLMETFVGT